MVANNIVQPLSVYSASFMMTAETGFVYVAMVANNTVDNKTYQHQQQYRSSAAHLYTHLSSAAHLYTHSHTPVSECNNTPVLECGVIEVLKQTSEVEWIHRPVTQNLSIERHIWQNSLQHYQHRRHKKQSPTNQLYTVLTTSSSATHNVQTYCFQPSPADSWVGGRQVVLWVLISWVVNTISK